MNRLVIEFDGEELNIDVPTSWSEVTVEKAAIFSSIKIYEGMTEYDYFIETLTTLCDNVDDDIAGALNEEEHLLVSEWLSFTKTVDVGEPKEFITIEGEDYYIKNDFNRLQNSEIISIKMIEDKHRSNLNYAIPELLCVFLRKKKDNGKLESFRTSFMERAAIFKNVMVTDVNHLFLFFLDGKNLLGLDTAISSLKK